VHAIALSRVSCPLLVLVLAARRAIQLVCAAAVEVVNGGQCLSAGRAQTIRLHKKNRMVEG
jgi:hypothetical protein